MVRRILCALTVLTLILTVAPHQAFAKKKRTASSKGAVSASSVDEPSSGKKGRKARKGASEAGPSSGEHMRLAVKGAMMMDAETGKILFAQDPDRLIPPASVTKLITLYIVYEAIAAGKVSPWEKIPVSGRAAGAGGSNMALEAGESVPLVELIKGMAVASANDACVAVAEYLAGDVDSFVARMNRKAKELGMANTTFKTPNGLPAPGQYTTARDILMLSKEYLKRYPYALDIHSTQFYTHNNITRHNANSLLGRVDGVDGLKTGFVCESGYNIALTAKRGDRRIVGALLGASSSNRRLAEATKLIDECYRRIYAGYPGVGSVAQAGSSQPGSSQPGAQAARQVH